MPTLGGKDGKKLCVADCLQREEVTPSSQDALDQVRRDVPRKWDFLSKEVPSWREHDDILPPSRHSEVCVDMHTWAIAQARMVLRIAGVDEVELL